MACGHSDFWRGSVGPLRLSGSACDPRSSSQITQALHSGRCVRFFQPASIAALSIVHAQLSPCCENCSPQSQGRASLRLQVELASWLASTSELRTFFKVCFDTDEHNLECDHKTCTERSSTVVVPRSSAQSHAVAARPPLRGRFPGGPRQSRTRFVSSLALTAQPGGACFSLSSTHRSPAIRM